MTSLCSTLLYSFHSASRSSTTLFFRYPWAGYCGQITLSTSQNVTIERNTIEVDPLGAGNYAAIAMYQDPRGIDSHTNLHLSRHINAHPHTPTHTRTHAHAHAHTLAHIYAHAHSYAVYTRARTNTHTCTHARTGTCAETTQLDTTQLSTRISEAVITTSEVEWWGSTSSRSGRQPTSALTTTRTRMRTLLFYAHSARVSIDSGLCGLRVVCV